MYIPKPLNILEDPPPFVQRKLDADKEEIFFVRLKSHSITSRPSYVNDVITFDYSIPPGHTSNSASALPITCNDAY